MSEITIRLYDALNKHGHFPTYPVGIKLVREDEKISQKAKYPLKNMGNHLSLCQGLTAARTFGWTIAFRK